MSEEKKRGIPAPNYTQIPNCVLDNMHRMSGQCFRVVIACCRATFGWHKQRDKISLTQLEIATGLSRQGVVNGLAEAVEKNLLIKEPVSDNPQHGFYYSVALVNSVDQSTQLTSGSQLNGPHKAEQVVNSVDTQKKEQLKERIKESTSRDESHEPPKIQTASPRPDKPKPDPIPKDNPIRMALVAACAIDEESKLTTKGTFVQLATNTRAFIAEGVTAQEIARAAAAWYRTDWRGQRNEAPTLSQFRAAFQKLINAKDTDNGQSQRTGWLDRSQRNAIATRADLHGIAQLEARLRDMENAENGVRALPESAASFRH